MSRVSDKGSRGEAVVPSQQSCPQFDACGAGNAHLGSPPSRFSSVIPDRSGYHSTGNKFERFRGFWN